MFLNSRSLALLSIKDLWLSPYDFQATAQKKKEIPVVWEFLSRSWRQEFESFCWKSPCCPAFDKQAFFTYRSRITYRQGKEIGVSPKVDFMLLLNICGAATRWRWELDTMTQTVVTSKGKAHVPVRKMQCQCEAFTSFSICCFLFFHVFFFTLSFLLWCKRFYGPLTSHISKWWVPDWNLLLFSPPFRPCPSSF